MGKDPEFKRLGVVRLGKLDYSTMSFEERLKL